MNTVETVLTCPLGSKCKEIKDNKMYRCAWLTELKGQNPQTGEQLDEEACAISWMPMMQVEVAQTQRGVSAAVVSLRDETIKRQDEFIGLAHQARLGHGN